jgi:hypothetical protein
LGEQHVKEDCYNYISTVREWVDAIQAKEKPVWMMRTLDLNID